MVYLQHGLDKIFPAGNFSEASGNASDDPGAWTTGRSKVFQQVYFTNYLMFDPGTPESIPVPVRKLVWSWSGTATNDGTQWLLLSSPNGASVLINDADATEFPVWSDNANNVHSYPTNSF